MEEVQIKELSKQALSEVLKERQEWFYDLIAEVVEDLALARAIREHEAGETVSREEILDILETKA